MPRTYADASAAEACFSTLQGVPIQNATQTWKVTALKSQIRQWPWVTLKGGARETQFFRRISIPTLVLFD